MVAQSVEATRYNIAGLIPDGVTGIFGSEVDSASDRNECQGYLLGGKSGCCVGLTTLPLSCASCVEILGAPTSWSHKGLSQPVME